MTVVDFVTDVLRNITVIGQTATPSAEQGQDAVTKLNDLMASLAEDGIEFGWNPKSTSAEDIVLPDGHRSAIKALLGVRLCDEYGLPVPQVMGAMADAGYQRLLRQSLHASMRESVSDAPAGENNGYTFNILTGQ